MTARSRTLFIRPDDLQGAAIRTLIAEHLAQMRSQSPAESVHALDLSGLQQPGITVYSAWQSGAGGDEALLGCAALRELDAGHGEVKSMRTQAVHRRTGVAQALLDHLIATARQRGYARLSLETGSQPEFEAARRLYARSGFAVCGPFGGYQPDPHSVFMTRAL